ncbi:MAG: hypothetical protein SVU32_09580 [Candidatus Nanohaloarchaea archaeon]|nr:hypothetical protein [Candidatus Nanohaloarchaea archaeon]
MHVLKQDLAEALEKLEEGDEDRAHEIIEDHRKKAVRMRKAVEEIRKLLDDHIDHLDELSNRTESWDIASVRNMVDELGGAMDEDSRLHKVMSELEDRFSEEGA